jgi:tocopherol cyclase
MIVAKQIRSLFNPEQYQGWGMTRKYFEGWYFKVVNADETKAFAFIPGIGMDEAGNSHSFIQVLDGKKKKSEYHTFSSTLFVPSEKGFELSIGKNYFSVGRIILDLPSVKGTLEFSGIVPWPKPWYSPGIMGPYTFAPFMECNHGVLSMDHRISGHLEIDGEMIDFTGLSICLGTDQSFQQARYISEGFCSQNSMDHRHIHRLYRGNMVQ